VILSASAFWSASSPPAIDRKQEQSIANNCRQKLSLAAAFNQMVSGLSGGSQRK
jgi:ABC-type sugar transport system ATPase subunit